MALQADTFAYRDDSVELSGHFAWEDRQTGKRPGILVIHAGPGLDEHTRGRARWLAELGYVAFACDMYGPGVAGNREAIMATMTELRGDVNKLRRRAAAGLEVLHGHPLVDGRVAAIGYCFGGMTVLALARGGTELAAAISVHGSLATQHPASPGAVKAKVLVQHGALDTHVPMAHVNAFVDEMKAAGADWQLVIYGAASHGFAHENMKVPLPGVAYHAATDARSKIGVAGFLREVFGGTGAAPEV
ncbi:MAG TPA: dienelactone hydrolase family protein [Dongiaceae bacterium]|nr:dienelactone hydrolase family protein [Dongiaceae bacterium]